MATTKVTLDLATMTPEAILQLARADIIPLRDAASILLARAGFTEEEVTYVTLPGAKRRMVNGHRNPTLSDEDFITLWNDPDLLLNEIGTRAAQSDETMRRRAKALSLPPRTRGRKRNGAGR